MSLRNWDDVDQQLAQIDEVLTEVDEGCEQARQLLPWFHVDTLDQLLGKEAA